MSDVGAIGVSAGILDKAGPLTEAERERVRTHPYLTARTFSKPPALAAIGQLAAKHHERLDGSGYPSGLTADTIPMTARLIAAADVYQALLEPRPHRDARARDAAQEVAAAEVTTVGWTAKRFEPCWMQQDIECAVRRATREGSRLARSRCWYCSPGG